jgi:hypothetical protein
MVLLLPDANNVWILLDLICNLNLFGYSPALNRAQLTKPVGNAALPAIRFFFLFWARILDVTEQAVWVFGNIAVTSFSKEKIRQFTG